MLLELDAELREAEAEPLFLCAEERSTWVLLELDAELREAEAEPLFL